MNAIKPLTKPAPLGRGLSALFGDADASYQPKPMGGAPAARDEKAGATVRTLPIEFVQPGAYQPRRHFDEEAINGLAESIRERGVLQPLMVRPIEGERDSYEIIAGERRWRAAQLAGLHEVPVVIRAMTDREAMEVGLIENVQRQDLSPLEEAEGYRRLMEEFEHTQEGLSKVVGKSRSHIANMIRLLTLPAPIKDMMESGKLQMGHARTLVTARDPMALAQEIVRRNLSVRQAEALAQRTLGNAPQSRKRLGKSATEADANLIALEKELERLVGHPFRDQGQSRGWFCSGEQFLLAQGFESDS